MKAILEFNLPEEREEFELHSKIGDYVSLLEDLRQYRRSLYKYEERKTIPTEEIVQKLDSILFNINYD